MRKKFELDIGIPEGINCEFSNEMIIAKKGDAELSRKISIPGVNVNIKDGKIKLKSDRANKKIISFVKAQVSHIKNLFKGLEEKFTYELEVVYVHFPITVKMDGKLLVISNFLGEKVNRKAKIIEGVDVKIDGQKIIVSSPDLEKAGQTAANIEKATKVSNRDRRVFQDGIFITSKPGGEI